LVRAVRRVVYSPRGLRRERPVHLVARSARIVPRRRISVRHCRIPLRGRVRRPGTVVYRRHRTAVVERSAGTGITHGRLVSGVAVQRGLTSGVGRSPAVTRDAAVSARSTYKTQFDQLTVQI
jgi:hypothetical protein